MNKTIKKILVASTLLTAMGVAQAELSTLEQQVIADHNSMEGMSAQERRDFRAQIFGNVDKVSQRSYNRAFKRMTEANLMPQLTNVGTVSVTSYAKAARLPGTQITYDTGTSTGVVTGQSSFMQGNQFDFAYNPVSSIIRPVEATGSVTQVTFSMLPGIGAPNVFVSMYSNIQGTTAAQVTSASHPATVGMNVLPLATALNYSNGPFLAGIWQLGGDAVAFDNASVNGQGFHGIEINDGGTGTGFATLGNVNAIFRVSGNVTTPVELMNFSVE